MWRTALTRQAATCLSNCTRSLRYNRSHRPIARCNHQIITEPAEAAKMDVMLEPYLLSTTPEKLTELPLIKLGDYVEVFRNGQYSGMVVGQKRSSGGLQQLTVLLRNGHLFEVRSDNVAFCINGFSNSQHVTQTVVDSFNPKDVDANGLLQTISPAYNRAIQNYQRTIHLNKGLAHQRLQQLYKSFVDKDGEKHVSLDQLACYAFKTKKPTALERHVTFMHLVADNTHFVPTLDVRGSNMWVLRSQKESEKIDRIIQSIRTRDAAYTGFLNRIKPLIEFYNTHADPILGTFSPTSLELVSKFTQRLEPSDATFINFVADWVKSPSVIVASPHEVFVPNLLKALKCYDNLFFDRSLATRFLREVGMFQPWSNIGLLENAPVAGEFYWTQKAETSDRKMKMYADAFIANDTSIFNDKDIYASARHDFGNLPVYTIDDASAKEIDDGISIEHVPGDNSAWLHVHIADPTTFISPTHELAQIMLQKAQTLYLPEQHFPMLNQDLSSKKFSLGATAHTNQQGSQYALTFSTRIDEQGNLLDYKVRPSLVKNVVKIYYDDLDELLQPKARVMRDPLIDLTTAFAHPSQDAFSPKKQNTSTVSDDAKQDLLDLFAMANKHSAKRIQQGAVLFSKANPVVDILPSCLDLPPYQFTKPSYPSHLPAVRVRLDKSAYSPARLMVAETMIMGGRIASKFAGDQGIALPFRTQSWNPKATTSDLNLRKEMMNSRDPHTGMIKMQDMMRFMSILPPTTIATEAGLPHVVMGIQDGYTRATSPLRRYMDMIVHWQLKSHLIGQGPVFSANQLKSLGSSIMNREKQLALLQQRSIQFWVVHMLDRMRADGFTQCKEWQCIVNMSPRVSLTELGGAMDVATGTILELGVRGRIEKLNREVQVGEVVKVRISSLDTLSGRVNLELI